MGLTRVAQDPWSESVSVPTFEPPPVEVKSDHVPLTAERAEELVKNHLERNGLSIRKSRDQLELTGAVTSTSSMVNTSAAGPGPSLSLRASSQPASASSSLSPAGRRSFRRPAPVALYPSGLKAVQSSRTPTALGPADLTNQTHVGVVAMGDVSANGEAGARRKALDTASLDGWMREADAVEEDVTDAVAMGIKAAPQDRRLQRPGSSNSQGTLSRRLSCPDQLMSLPGEGEAGLAVVSKGAAAVISGPSDALEPLANHHMWMFNRGRMDGGGQGLLYSAAGVLRAGEQGDRAAGGGWKPRDVASSLFAGGAWDSSLRGSGGGVRTDLSRRTRVAKLIQSDARVDAVHSLAAVIIQSYCRGWQARRRAARMQNLQRDEESRRLTERAAAAALARERETVRRRLRAAARDCLLAIQAQFDYERTRARMAAARGLSGCVTAAPPPPPSIPQSLWERCMALGQDPIEVLLESGMQSHQVEEIISASQLASQLPRRAAAAAARMGLSLAPVPEGGGGSSRPVSRSSYGGGGAPTTCSKGGRSSDDGSAAAAGVVTMATAATRRGVPSLSRRLSLPGRPLLPSRRSSSGMMLVTPVSKQQQPAATSTSQLMEQMLAAQQLTQQQQQYGTYGSRYFAESQGGFGPAVRQASGPGALPGGGAPPPPAPPLHRQPSQSHGSLALAVDGSSGNVNNPGGVRQAGFHPGSVAPAPHAGAGFAAAGPPMRAPPPPVPPQQLYPATSHTAQQHQPQQQPGSFGGGPRTGGPLPLRGNSLRMSDFIGGGGGSGSSAGGAAPPTGSLSLAAVGSTTVAAAAPPGPVRSRSMVVSDSGAIITSPPALLHHTTSSRILLPAMQQTASLTVGGGTTAALSSQSSDDLRSGGGSADSPPTVSSLPPQPPQQETAPLPQHPHNHHHHLPQHLQALVTSALSSPITRAGPQSSPGGSADGSSTALLLRHSFVEPSGGGGGGATSSPTGGRTTGSAAPSTAAAAAAGVAGGGFHGPLPPLLLSQASGSSAAGISGIGSPAAASRPHLAAAAPPPADAVLGPRVPSRRTMSNLAPQGSLPLPGAPPVGASSKSFRRLHSLTYGNPSAASAAAAIAAAAADSKSAPGGPSPPPPGGPSPPPPALTRVMSAGGGGGAAAAAASTKPLAPPGARPPAAVLVQQEGVVTRAG